MFDFSSLYNSAFSAALAAAAAGATISVVWIGGRWVKSLLSETSDARSEPYFWGEIWWGAEFHDEGDITVTGQPGELHFDNEFEYNRWRKAHEHEDD